MDRLSTAVTPPSSLHLPMKPLVYAFLVQQNESKQCKTCKTYYQNIHKYINAWKLLIWHVIRHRLQLDYGAGLDFWKVEVSTKKLSFTFKRVSSLIVFDRLENPVRRNVCRVYEKWSIAISQRTVKWNVWRIAVFLHNSSKTPHWNSKWWLY